VQQQIKGQSYTSYYCSLVLLDAEEIFALERTVLGQVCAVNGIATTVNTEASTQRVRAQVLCYFRIHRTGKVTERLNCVLLADFHDDARSSRHLLAHWRKLGQDSLVDLEELLGCWSVKVEHLHSRDFKALRKDNVDDLTGKTCLNGVGLDHSASVV